MAHAPLWLNIEQRDRSGDSVAFSVSLASCRNCGKVKATSDPCSLDHLAAVMEFGQFLRDKGYLPDPRTTTEVPF